MKYFFRYNGRNGQLRNPSVYKIYFRQKYEFYYVLWGMLQSFAYDLIRFTPVKW